MSGYEDEDRYEDEDESVTSEAGRDACMGVNRHIDNMKY